MKAQPHRAANAFRPLSDGLRGLLCPEPRESQIDDKDNVQAMLARHVTRVDLFLRVVGRRCPDAQEGASEWELGGAYPEAQADWLIDLPASDDVRYVLGAP